nr:hypothetical protein [Tanacetum cinerariifolium]
MPRECLAIIESKFKVHYSRNKPVVAKVSTNTSTYGISPDVAELKDRVKAILLDKKSKKQAPATIKEVEESCVTCGGAHSYRNCPATDGNVYRDNIQEFISQSFAVNYNQRNTSYRPPMMSNQIRPPGFPPVPNNQNVQLNRRNNQNRFNQNQNRGNNFNHGPVYQPSVFQPSAYQAPAYQASAPQTQGVLKEDFSAYIKANDAFVNSNSASTSSSGTLPNNTIANSRSDLKTITTRSGVSYDGPQIPPPPSFLPKVMENKPKETKDTVHPTNNGISALRPNQRPSIPYPSRLQDQKLRDKANDQQLTDRSISRPVGVAEDVYVKVGTIHFSADFVVVDFDSDPRVPLILGRSFLKTKRALIDVFEEYSQEVLGFSDVITSGNPTPYYDLIVSTPYPTLTTFGNSDFLLEEVDAFLALEDDPASPEVDQSYLDFEGDILLLKSFLNDDPSLPPPN